VTSKASVSNLVERWRRRRRKNFHVDARTELRSIVRGQLYWDSGGDWRDTVLVAGQGRSGTTWVSEILRSGGGYRAIDEPFHPGRLSITREFKPRQYVRPGERDTRLLDPATRIVSGRVRSPWIDRYNRKLLPRKRIVKETRGNLLLPWLSISFPGMPIVLVIRHPCAVVASQFALEPDWQVDLRRFTSQRSLMEDYLEPFGDELEAAATRGSEFERHIFAWCIENLVPLRLLPEGEIHVAYYENFVTKPLDELTRLFAFLGSEVGDDVFEALQKPSHSTRKDSAVVRAENPVDSWKKAIGPDRSDRAMEILGYFGLDRIYGEDGLPRAGDAAALRFPLPRGHEDAPPANDAGPV